MGVHHRQIDRGLTDEPSVACFSALIRTSFGRILTTTERLCPIQCVGDPSSAEVGQFRQTDGRPRPIFADSGGLWQMLAHLWAKSAHVWSKSAHESSMFRRILSRSAHVKSMCGRSLAIVQPRFGPNSAPTGRLGLRVSQIRPNSANFGKQVASFGQLWPNFGRGRPNLSGSWSNLGRNRPMFADSGEFRPQFAQRWAKAALVWAKDRFHVGRTGPHSAQRAHICV